MEGEKLRSIGSGRGGVLFFLFCVLAGPCKIILSKVMRNVFETRFRLQFKDDYCRSILLVSQEARLLR